MFKTYLTVPLLLLLSYIIATLAGAELTKRGRLKPTLRRLPAIDAIEEAVNRSTEMGRPVHYTVGFGGGRGVNEPGLIPGLGILQNVATLCARNNIPLIHTCGFGELMPIADEAIREGAVLSGNPEWYRPEYNRFISQEVYSYALGVVNIIENEKPGASFLIGNVWGEALIITEPAAAQGIMQVSGCRTFSAMPFLIASCDYVLILSEMYNVSAYYTKDEMLVGSYLGTDTAQLITVILLILGFVLALSGQDLFKILTKW
jgi:hypothetical protein